MKFLSYGFELDFTGAGWGTFGGVGAGRAHGGTNALGLRSDAAAEEEACGFGSLGLENAWVLLAAAASHLVYDFEVGQ